jgi:hypothetical protein
MDEYNITDSELSSLKAFFKENAPEPDLVVKYNGDSYGIRLYNVLNDDVNGLLINGIYPFRDDGFISAFTEAMETYTSNELLTSSISKAIKNNYQNIIIDKVLYEMGNTASGPKTFESLLFRDNSSLYRYLVSMKSNGEDLILLMRAIIKALEDYTNSSLAGLEFNALGVDDYFHILKEVISYFKSYMVEYTKEEFVYIFDGLFDYGGNSNMLRMFDEITSVEADILPQDSMTMYDVSCADMIFGMKDNNTDLMYDEALFRVQATYQELLNSGYEIWYDDGKKITKTTPTFEIDNSTKIVANIVSTNNDNTTEQEAYKIIVNIDNLDPLPPNYVGNGR